MELSNYGVRMYAAYVVTTDQAKSAYECRTISTSLPARLGTSILPPAQRTAQRAEEGVF
ncbi:hypothetical protein N8H22_04620 [Stutzerimonas stutzeri]|uniref:hypothetical protein n=1 Tax=Stutzerimonas sp. S1 TaxID=3030652 RepID=UPI0022244448|nr:hypothetical protein [Stutzerimonas sp. S1]MCW3147890.1 hypothetical protein [Stutzerimonas sp. S1]